MNVFRSAVFALLATAALVSAPVYAGVSACCVGGDCCAHGKCCTMSGCCKVDKSCCDPAKGICTSACGCLATACCGTGYTTKKVVVVKGHNRSTLAGKASLAAVKTVK